MDSFEKELVNASECITKKMVQWREEREVESNRIFGSVELFSQVRWSSRSSDGGAVEQVDAQINGRRDRRGFKVQCDLVRARQVGTSCH